MIREARRRGAQTLALPGDGRRRAHNLRELRDRLAKLEDTCEVVRGELDALTGRIERAGRLERDMEVLLEQTADVRAEDLDALTGDQRNEIYRMLRLEITPSGEGYAVSGVFRIAGLPSRGPRWA